MTKRLVRIAEACAITGDKRSSFYIKVKDGTYPKPVATGPRTRAWVEGELLAVVDRMIRARDASMKPTA